ncbi:MAG TPA: CoA-binding protein [bacterium]|nr:CoA-binding protein [bacterium]
MTTLSAKVGDFLSQRRVAVAGVSRTRQDAAANLIYRRFKARGYEVFPVNPNAARVEGDPCFPDLRSIPGGVDGVVIVTRPQLTEEIVRQCPAAGVKRVWMHRSMAHGDSVSATAVDFCRANGITVIAGACPLMFGQTADFGHKGMRWVMGLTGRLPA